QAEDGIRDFHGTGVQTCALPIYLGGAVSPALRMFCKDAPEEPGAFQRFYGFATAGAAWKDALLADTPLTVIERRNFKWPMDKPEIGRASCRGRVKGNGSRDDGRE